MIANRLQQQARIMRIHLSEWLKCNLAQNRKRKSNYVRQCVILPLLSRIAVAGVLHSFFLWFYHRHAIYFVCMYPTDVPWKCLRAKLTKWIAKSQQNEKKIGKITNREESKTISATHKLPLQNQIISNVVNSMTTGICVSF